MLTSFRENFFDSEQKMDLYIQLQHLWFPFLDRAKRNLLREFFSANSNYIYVSKPMFFDRVFAPFYQKNAEVRFHKVYDAFFDFIIQGDCIAKIYMPQLLRKRMDKVYSLRGVNFKIIDEFADMTYSKYDIKIIICRDKEIAAEIKKELKK